MHQELKEGMLNQIMKGLVIRKKESRREPTNDKTSFWLVSL